MSRLTAAEWILSLVMPPKRASATVGDLLEVAPHARAFWSMVSRTVLGTVLRQVIGAPWQMAGAAIAMVGMLWVFTFVVMLLAMVVMLGCIPFAGIAGQLFGRDTSETFHWLSSAMEVAFALWIPFEVARQVARLYRGKELAAWTAMLAAWCAVRLIGRISAGSVVVEMSIPALFLPPMLLGVIVERRAALTRG